MATRMLTEADVQRLMSSPSGDVRAETATKVAQAFDTGSLSAIERELASAIFPRHGQGRGSHGPRGLAQNLKSNPDLPKDVALSLANAKDIESVSLPVLEYSRVLTDGDLIDIVRVAGPRSKPRSPAGPRFQAPSPKRWSITAATRASSPPWSPTPAPSSRRC